jgi:diguanylate cyclase (GGDEF)-like protein
MIIDEPWVQARVTRDLRKILNPGACLAAMNLLKSQHGDFGDIAAVLQADPVLSIKTISVANLIRGDHPPVLSLERAVQMLGVRHVYLIVLSVLMMSMVIQRIHPTRRRRQIWRWVLSMAVAADLLGARGMIPQHNGDAGNGHKLERLVSGLLPGIGVLMMETGAGRSFRKLLRTPIQPLDLSYRESTALGATHWDVALWALRSLHAPPVLLEPAQRMSREAVYDDQQEQIALSLRAIEVLGAWIANLERDRATVWLADAAPRLNLDIDQLDSDLPQLRRRVLELARSLRVEVAAWQDDDETPLLVTAGVAVNELVVDNLQLSDTLARQQWKDLVSAIARQVARHQADIDPLTGLMNRRGLMATLSKISPNGNRVALVLMDVDRFKQINDELGHSAGDQVLRLLARTIQETLPSPLMATRLGGDEFAVVLGAHQRPLLDEWVTNFRVRLRKDSVAMLQRRVSVSIGAKLLDARRLMNTWEQIYQDVDRLLYQAKIQGRDQALISE